MTDPKAAVHKIPNRLIHATSPYLLQHAYNPVDWFEWTAEALDKAKKEDKPIVVSIGYSSCHWCHVMERESFENADVAANMNEFFVCIKVDREERPDIDQVYMEAVQAMGINGGWPLNVFLTPDQKPFYGGTYFPASAWSQLLKNIHQAYQTRKAEINESADELTKIIAGNGLDKFRTSNKIPELSKSIEITYQQLEKKFDTIWGGLDKAPKFIMPSIWQWLLRYYHLTKNENAIAQISLTLTKILDGGIYDQVGGGFARYSVDGEWFAPHFEKMLYDNAQLVSVYANAFVVTRNPDYKRAVDETFDWLTREMTHPDGGFYSALDADSEGVEGKFYVWTKAELESVLQDDAPLFCEYFGVTVEGNWEHGQNILKRITSDENFIQKNNLNLNTWNEKLSRCKSKLLQVREHRVRPGLDDKILIGWNAMMITGLVDAYHAFSDEKFLESAKNNLLFLETHLTEGPVLYRSFKNKRSTTEAFLEDYAYMLNAYIKLYQADFNERYLHSAEKLASYVIENFFDQEDKLFFYTNSLAEKLIARKKELFDNVIPSSNSLMAINLYQLGIFLDNSSWKTMAENMIANFAELIQNEPNYMSNWGIAFLEINNGLSEVAIVGKDAVELKNALHQHYLPFALFMGTETTSNFPLLRGKVAQNNNSMIYVCKDYSCKQPVHTVDDAHLQLVNKS